MCVAIIGFYRLYVINHIGGVVILLPFIAVDVIGTVSAAAAIIVDSIVKVMFQG